MASASVSTSQGLRRHLSIYGSDLAELMQIGALLQDGFASTSLVHTSQPLLRAGESRASDAIGLVLVDGGMTADGIRDAVASNPDLIFLTDDDVPALETLGAIAIGVRDALLQATVASFAAQLGHQRTH